MANTYRMTNTQGEVHRVRSSSFDGYPRWPGYVRLPWPRDEQPVYCVNAAEAFAQASCYPVLVVDETDGDRFVGIFGAEELAEYDRADYWRPTTEELKVAEWEEWAADHALAEAFVVAPVKGENVAWRAERNQINKDRAIQRRYSLRSQAARRRTGKRFPPLEGTLLEARNASRRAEERLRQPSNHA